MVGYKGSSTLMAPAIAITVVDVPGQFDNLTFGVASDRSGNKPEVGKHKYLQCVRVKRSMIHSTIASD